MLTSAIHTKVESPLIISLSCGNTLKPQGGPHPFGAGRSKRFRSSAAVHSQDRDESRLVRSLGPWLRP